jgi:hypothetical protein
MYTRYSNSWLPVNADKSALCLWLWAVTRTESCHGNRGGPVLPPFMHVSHSPPRLHQQSPAVHLHPVPSPHHHQHTTSFSPPHTHTPTLPPPPTLTHPSPFLAHPCDSPPRQHQQNPAVRLHPVPPPPLNTQACSIFTPTHSSEPPLLHPPPPTPHPKTTCHSPPRLHQQTPAGLLHPVPHPQPSLGTQRHHPAGECSVGCVTAAAAATAAAAVAAVSAAPKINRTRLQQGGASPPPPRDLHQVLKRTIQLGSALWGKGQRNICPQHACLLSVFNMLTLKACKTPCFPTHLDVVLHHVPQ